MRQRLFRILHKAPCPSKGVFVPSPSRR